MPHMPARTCVRMHATVLALLFVQLTTSHEWIDVFDGPPTFVPLSEEVFPLGGM